MDDLPLSPGQRGQIDTRSWALLSPRLDVLLDLDEAARAQQLAAWRAADPVLADTLEQLLRDVQAVSAERFLEDDLHVTRMAPAAGAGTVCGAWTLEHVLGAGGMGTVWLARRSDGRYEGQVAIKLLNLALLGRGGAERFAREGSVLARLTHPNIARLLDAGVATGGQPFLVLERIQGDPIDRWCSDRSLEIRARLLLFLDVLAAVDHAHKNLILHRDLKPSNILVTPDGQVKLLDFGIAKLLNEQRPTAPTELTQAAGSAFTPDYAAPEQVAGGTVTTATDVYELGVLLYVLLAGVHPTAAEGQTPVERLRAISEVEPVHASEAVLRCAPSPGFDPKHRARALRGDLDNIVAKALRKAPEERYRSVEAFAQDIERHLEGRPVHARPASRWLRTRKFVARNALAVSAAAAVVLATTAGAAVAVWQADQARSEARKARAVQGFLVDVFLANTHEQADPLRAQKTTARELLTVGAQRVAAGLADAPEIRVEVLGTLGELLLEFGLADEAVGLERNRVQALRALYGAGDARVARALLRLSEAMETSTSIHEREAVVAEAQHILGGRAEAEPLLRADLAVQRAKLLQERDPEQALQRAREATALFKRQGLQARAAEALALEAEIADDAGAFDDAERAYLEGLAIARGLASDRHRVLPRVLIGLAALQGQLLKSDDADRHFREAIAVTERVYGREHANYLESIYQYGTFLGQNSRSAEAVPYLHEAVDTNRRVRGDGETFHAPKYLALLGAVLADHGLAHEAVPLLDRAVKLKKDAGTDNLALAAFLHLAARAPLETGEIPKATAYLDQARDIIARHEGQSTAGLPASHRTERARLALRVNRAGESVRLMRELLGPVREGPRTRPDLARYLLLAESEAANGEWDAAANTSRNVRAAIERLGLTRAAVSESARLDVVDAKAALARADTQAASALLRRALSARQVLLDPRSPLIAEALLELAQARWAAGEPLEARSLLREARRVLSTQAGVSPQLARLTAETTTLIE